MKTAILTEDYPQFQLLETIKLENNQYVLLDQHLSRLAKSARYFGFPINMKNVEYELDSHKDLYRNITRRVRLLIFHDGRIQIESSPLARSGDEPHIIAIADSPITSTNRFLYHKTTNRSIYEKHRTELSDVFDTLLWNEKGEITEFTTGNIVLELDEQKLTPKINCGLLPGTLRTFLIDTKEISEAVLTVTDLKQADKIWYINSVRGWIPVHLKSAASNSKD